MIAGITNFNTEHCSHIKQKCGSTAPAFVQSPTFQAVTLIASPYASTNLSDITATLFCKFQVTVSDCVLGLIFIMEPQEKKLKIASLGSSFAAGPDIPPQIEPIDAGRSGQNYPHLLAKHLNADLTDLTVSGATLLNITVHPQSTPFSETFPPQISGLPEDTNIITLTAGGNDLGYIGGMISDACGERFQITPLSPSQLAERFGGVLDEIHKRAPRARVYLVEYLAVLGPDTKADVDIPLNQERIEHYRQVASVLQHAYAAVEEGRSDWCERVPIHELSQGHALGSKEPWVGGFVDGPLLHPNLNGMKAVAEILVERVRKTLASKASL
jgi:lysophospholipase L1-like esterase